MHRADDLDRAVKVLARDPESIGCGLWRRPKMMRTLILATVLVAPFAVQAQTFEVGPGGIHVSPHGGGNCRELRAACMHKEELGETGMGNCQRYRELCTGGARSEYHHRHVYEEQ
jgi:hypothetical protein